MKLFAYVGGGLEPKKRTSDSMSPIGKTEGKTEPEVFIRGRMGMCM